MTLPSEKAEGFIMFRVSGEVEYNLSVIPALCGQLRPGATLRATQCHLHRVSAGVEEDCMDGQEVSQHRFMSEIEIWVLSLTDMYVCADYCSQSCFIPYCRHADGCKTHTIVLRPGLLIIGLFHLFQDWTTNQYPMKRTKQLLCERICCIPPSPSPVSCWAFITIFNRK